MQEKPEICRKDAFEGREFKLIGSHVRKISKGDSVFRQYVRL